MLDGKGSWPRHQLRAQGRRLSRTAAVVPGSKMLTSWHQPRAIPTLTPPNNLTPEAGGSADLLDFLSRTAVQHEEELLYGIKDPGFVPVQHSLPRLAANALNQAEIDNQIEPTAAPIAVLEQEQSQKQPQLQPTAVTARFQQSALAQLADSITDQSGFYGQFYGEEDRALSQDLMLATSSFSEATALTAPAIMPKEAKLSSATTALTTPAIMPRQAKLSSATTARNLANASVNGGSGKERRNVERRGMRTRPTGRVKSIAESEHRQSERRRHRAEANTGAELDMAESLELSPLSQAELVGNAASAARSADAFRSMLKELNDWLSASQSSTDQSSADPLLDDPLNETYESSEYFTAAKLAKSDLAPLVVPPGPVKPSRPLFRHVAETAVKVKQLSHGRRLECYQSGAMLQKDELGQVEQIRAANGSSISIHRDREGNPDRFVRRDENGQNHSLGECDEKGVTVRDLKERVLAAGDVLVVDPHGCVGVNRADGQFWNIDLIRGLHIERRRLADAKGGWHVLTAIFASDGFRMMTMYQPVAELPILTPIYSQADADSFWSHAPIAATCLRFYGRDGSVIQFESEEELTNLCPSWVSAPGIRHVEPNLKGKHQAGTAWLAVQEYVSSYLSN